MGLFKALDTLVHGGVEQPESYDKKKDYTINEVLGCYHDNSDNKNNKNKNIHINNNKMTFIHNRKWLFWISKESNQNQRW
jgi:hypothetical protein